MIRTLRHARRLVRIGLAAAGVLAARLHPEGYEQARPAFGSVTVSRKF